MLNDLIDTGGTAKQPNHRQEDIKVLCEVALKEQMVSLAEHIAKLVNDDRNFQSLLNNEIVLQFHVILARDVVDVSEIQPAGHRVATFRPNFFNISEKYLTIFKDTLFKEILKNRKIKSTNVNTFLTEYLAEPTNATKLSKVIGTVVKYNNGLLEMRKQYTEYFTPQLKQVHVSQLTVNRALELAAREILLSPKLKLRVPSPFGNKDITLRGSDEKKKERIQWLATKITDLLVKCESSNTESSIVTIDDSILKGLLELNGGIAGAIGSLFVLDDDTKLMKVTDNAKSLGTLAKQLFERLNEEIDSINKDKSKNKLVSNLCEYKFSFKVSKFPRLLLEPSENEENFAKDFLNKLVIYSNQANEKSVEEKLKSEIDENLTLSDSSQAKIDEMFLKYHNEIQNWWMQSKDASYLTKNSQIFEKATSYIIEDPLISSISVPYVRNLKRYNYTFSADAVESLNLQLSTISIIVAENSILSIAKVMQHFNYKDIIALDIEYIVKLKLSTKKRQALQRELTNTNKKVIILVCEKIQDSEKERKYLKNLVEAVRSKKTIIIANHLSVEILEGYFNTVRTVHDQRNSLIDMSVETRKRVLKCARVEFQGMEVELEHLVSGWPIVGTSN